MMVMSLEKTLRLRRMDPHQVLVQQGDLTKFKPGMFVIFISHEWTSASHPDPSMEQFRVFQEVFGPSGLVAGNPPRVESQWLDQIVGNACCINAPEWKKMLKNPAKIFVW
jgi:hypothetical protein